ncbi:MAG: class I SAM-dependent methyltransferase [Candidatus Norongarragalinales archaeon]
MKKPAKREGWVVKRERPEEKTSAIEFYEAGGEAIRYSQSRVMQRIQRQLTLRALLYAGFSEGARLLDAGCGNGYCAVVAKQAGYAVKAFDLSPTMVELARRAGVDARVGDLRRIPFPSRSFDGVFSVSALQWLKTKEDLAKAAKEFYRVLRKNGSAVVQWFPKSEEEMLAACRAFKHAGFEVTLRVENPENARKRRVFLLCDKR